MMDVSVAQEKAQKPFRSVLRPTIASGKSHDTIDYLEGSSN
jgi:hypothetical protein